MSLSAVLIPNGCQSASESKPGPLLAKLVAQSHAGFMLGRMRNIIRKAKSAADREPDLGRRVLLLSLLGVVEKLCQSSGEDRLLLDLATKKRQPKSGDGLRAPVAGGLSRYDRFKQMALETALAASNGNRKAAAAWLGVSRAWIYDEQRRLGLND